MLQITPLNAIWLDYAGAVRSVRQPVQYRLASPSTGKANGLLINLLMAAAVCAVVASNLGTAVVMAEHGASAPCSSPAVAKRATVVCAGPSRYAAAGNRLLAGGSATARWIWGCWINALSTAAGLRYLAARRYRFWSAGRDYPATRLLRRRHANASALPPRCSRPW